MLVLKQKIKHVELREVDLLELADWLHSVAEVVPDIVQVADWLRFVAGAVPDIVEEVADLVAEVQR